MQFQGGYGELTTDDVKFSFERIAGMTKPALQSAYVADWAPQLKEVQIASKYEGTIVLNNVFAPLMHTTLPTLSGLIVSKKAVLDRGKQFGAHPIGSGPYQVQSFTPNRKVVLTKFAKWSGASKGVRSAVLRQDHDHSQRRSDLRRRGPAQRRSGRRADRGLPAEAAER